MDLATLRRKIPELLTKLGEDPASVALGDDAWVVHHGSATGYVAILGAERARGRPVPAREVPRGPGAAAGPGGAVRARCSASTTSSARYAAFSVDENDCVWLGAGRFCDDVEEPELLELVTQTARLADRYDDQLIETFGPELGLE